MDANIFTELSIVIAIGAVISLVMRLIKQPLIIGYILTGIVVGPSVLHIVKNESTINVFASIGIALLLFIIGLGLNPRVIKEVGKVTLITGGIQILLTTLAGFLFSRAFGWSKTESLFVGLALAFSSTIIILKLLSDKKEQTRLYGKITIGILLLQDIVAALALVLVAARSEGAFSFTTLIWLGVKGLAVGVPLYLISLFVLPRMNKVIAGSQEFLFLFAIGWGFGAAALFEHFGFSLEVGALFAGVALATLPYAQEIASRLRPLRDFFVVVFFIALGTRLSISNAFSLILPIAIFLIIVVLVKPLIVMTTMGILGYTKNTSFKAAGSLAQISEFSLVFVLLGQQQGLVRPDIANIMTIVALITIATSSYAITYSNQIYTLLESHLTMFERKKTHKENTKPQRYDMVLFGYNKGGQEFVRVMEQMKKKYVVVDYDPEVIDTLDHQNITYLYGDVTDLELLEELNMANAKLVVSTVSDHDTNLFLARWLENVNPHAVFVCAADTAGQASSLYEEGAAYVMMPHYIGSEKIGSFIKRNGFNKSEFRKFREKHLQYLETHYT
ncbi:MAG: cation:proton antiporter [Candidatus Saccharimonadales bacterium]